ncbi:putative protein (DUF177 domain) [Campylobacter pinnipediorum subsp. caledonicus]|uniref:DUF177 domain protein n=1 Tax=Campylobacter pinnipediorum subsp. caledonicus TaxID=1874362 RepID=A0A1S6U683_9BACT|nr:hypothetical protein [Campylobacter pinnipediorum]AQW85642.1 putative protein (DUF177 domain) [Campylobacter pinnipediorum subsp. caledonicus]AQW87251.1 putative protein (DUF177 domain) [Campylobacter pinnipediorum subsp. caledonicus]
MKINFLKISNNGFPFDLDSNGLKFFGNLRKADKNLVLCEAKMTGKTDVLCDRCGKEMTLELDEDIKIFISDGVYNDEGEDLMDVIEFFNNEIDLDEVFESELQAYKSDYFYCNECENL